MRMLTSLMAVLLSPGAAALASDPPDEFTVCATTTTLGHLTRELLGEDARVVVFAKGSEDAHFVEARPSFLRDLHDADALVLNGLSLEIGWLPVLVQNARNPDVLPGARAWLDASRAIRPLQVPDEPVDRSQGDVHVEGNPHYLTDPLRARQVVQWLAERLGALAPARAEAIAARARAWDRRMAEAMVGPALVAQHGAEVAWQMATLHERGALGAFLEQQGITVGGWLGQALPLAGTTVVVDHNLWPYFAERFRLKVAATLEPKPGIPPTTRSLTAIVTRMQEESIPLILGSPYYDPRFLRFVADKTGARGVVLAHEVESLPDIADYRSMIQHNLDAVAKGLAPPQETP